jgi:vitamin B12 transporter
VFPNTARNASGESRRHGVEASAHADIGDGFTLDAAYTYLDAKESEDAAEIRRPHHIASASVNWRFADDRANLNLGFDYHGSQRDTAFLNVPPFSMPVTLGGYSLVRVAGSYDVTDNFTLFARVENAFDEHYEEVFGYRTRGFGVFAGIRARFD